jgi:hypothetical protein
MTPDAIYGLIARVTDRRSRRPIANACWHKKILAGQARED